MRKLNNKGFALVETLIVSVFVMGIFTLLYTNYYPLIGEYEKRENYDSIEAVYRTDLLKRFINSNGVKNNVFNGLRVGDKFYFYHNQDAFCNQLNNLTECKTVWENLKINSILLTNYTINTVKANIKENSNINNGMKEYVNYLPDYKNNQYQYRGRIIVEYKEIIDEESVEESYTIYKYATLGADLYD